MPRISGTIIATGAALPTIHAYVDETVFEAGGRRFLGAGALITSTSVDPGVISSTMAALAADPDRIPGAARFDAMRERLDLATLHRGYFHASEDSANGHSHLARSILRSVNGVFRWSFAEAPTRTDEEAFRSHTIGAVLGAIKSRSSVNLVVEQRSGFDRASADALVETIWGGLDFGAYQNTMLQAHYPEVTTRVLSKSAPGLQVADLLLWAAAQAKHAPGTTKARIAGWCGLRPWAEAGYEGDTGRWITCNLNETDPVLDAVDTEWTRFYPVGFPQIEDGMNNEKLADVYLLVERTLRAFVASGFPAHAAHLRPAVEAALHRLAGNNYVGPDEVEEVCRQFVRLFDTAPVYRGLPDGDPGWLLLVRAKRFAGLALRSDLINGITTRDFFARVREANAETSPALLGLPGSA